MPGFYGVDVKGQIKTFSRGGSDISGAIAARAAKAALYENWTDVSGLLMADPRIVENPHPLDEVSYREIRELSYMGANVFHDEAIAPVRDAGIPINIRNTNRPDDPGHHDRFQASRGHQVRHRRRGGQEELLHVQRREEHDEQGNRFRPQDAGHLRDQGRQHRAYPQQHRQHERGGGQRGDRREDRDGPGGHPPHPGAGYAGSGRRTLP